VREKLAMFSSLNPSAERRSVYTVM
jgi:hypothetical protein